MIIRYEYRFSGKVNAIQNAPYNRLKNAIHAEEILSTHNQGDRKKEQLLISESVILLAYCSTNITVILNTNIFL